MNAKTALIIAAVLAFLAAAGSGKLSGLLVSVLSAVFGLDAAQRNSVAEITQAFAKYGDADRRKLVYILALAYHESRLRPIKEIKAAPGTYVWENYQKNYWPSGYYGRGYVQLTLEGNYQKMSNFLGVDLVANPDLALVPTYAAQIIVYGMMNGSFTGKRLSQYINSDGSDYYNARRTVGAITVAGQDTASIIQGYAISILSKLPIA